MDIQFYDPKHLTALKEKYKIMYGPKITAAFFSSLFLPKFYIVGVDSNRIVMGAQCTITPSRVKSNLKTIVTVHHIFADESITTLDGYQFFYHISNMFSSFTKSVVINLQSCAFKAPCTKTSMANKDLLAILNRAGYKAALKQRFYSNVSLSLVNATAADKIDISPRALEKIYRNALKGKQLYVDRELKDFETLLKYHIDAKNPILAIDDGYVIYNLNENSISELVYSSPNHINGLLLSIFELAAKAKGRALTPQEHSLRCFALDSIITNSFTSQVKLSSISPYYVSNPAVFNGIDDDANIFVTA